MGNCFSYWIFLMTDMTGALVRLHFFFKLLFTITTFTIMLNKFQEHCLTHWHTALPVRRGEMVHQIRFGNQSAFAFMTRINSITPKLSTRFQSICRCCDNPNFSYYCSVYDKVFIETLQPEIHVRKISIKKQSEGTFESYSQRVSQM